MPEADDSQKEKEFYVDIPARCEAFFLKGCNSIDWGMKNRLSKIFDPNFGQDSHAGHRPWVFSGSDHRPRAGGRYHPAASALRRHSYAYAGHPANIIPPTFGKGIVLRASGGPSILSDLSNEQIAIDIDEAIRLNVAAMAVQVFIGGKMETQSVHNMTRLVDMGNRYGIPTLGVTAVGKDMARDAKYMRLACRIIAELASPT